VGIFTELVPWAPLGAGGGLGLEKKWGGGFAIGGGGGGGGGGKVGRCVGLTT